MPRRVWSLSQPAVSWANAPWVGLSTICDSLSVSGVCQENACSRRCTLYSPSGYRALKSIFNPQDAQIRKSRLWLFSDLTHPFLSRSWGSMCKLPLPTHNNHLIDSILFHLTIINNSSLSSLDDHCDTVMWLLQRGFIHDINELSSECDDILVDLLF